MAGGAYVIAVKRGRDADVPPDWATRLAAVPGVSVTGSTTNRARFVADAAAVEQVQKQFGELFHIEQEGDRTIL